MARKMTGMPWPLKPAAMNFVFGGSAVEAVDEWALPGMAGITPTWGRESDVQPITARRISRLMENGACPKRI